MYLERLSVQGVDSNSNPNKYFAPSGVFNTAAKLADVNLPNCTMYCMCRGYEAMEASERFPWIRSTPGFGNAKTWFSTTTMPKGYQLREGSIAVFDGNCGHVAFVERVLDSTHAIISESNYSSVKTRRDWMYWRARTVELKVGKATLSGVGKLIGFIYLPINKVSVSLDETKDQVEVNCEALNVRVSPSITADKYTGLYCPLGIYNVLNKEEADGFTWYKISSKSWIAGVDGVIYYPAIDTQTTRTNIIVEDNSDEDTKIMSDWIQPKAVDENKEVDQIYINNNSGVIRIRKGPSTKEAVMGVCVNKVYYNLLNKEDKSDFTWYKIGEESWVAGIEEVEYRKAIEWYEPVPVEEDATKNQVFINNTSGLIRIRETASLKGKVKGFVENKAYYNVIDTTKAGGYTWYHLGTDAYIAGIEEVEYIPAHDVKPDPKPDPAPQWIAPVPVERDTNVNQVRVAREINIRKEATTSSDAMATTKVNVYYNVSEVATNEYTWYKIGDNAWIANVAGVEYYEISIIPTPAKEDHTKNQLFVPDVSLSIRDSSSTSGKRIGFCEPNSNYDVLGIESKSDYIWYKLAEGAWVAGIEEVIYYPAGSSRIIPELKKELPALKNSLDIAINCVNKNISPEHYDELYAKVAELNKFINENFDSFDYDIVDPNEYNEIDLLYTADVHGAWVGYDEDGNYLSPVFNYDDLNSYRTKLKKNNIKALLVDCGDWSRPCRVYTDYVNTGEMVSATQMNTKDYFASTYGNHEWKWGDPNETISILNKNKSMTACNFFKNGKLVYKPYRTAKIGSKRIGVIGIGYPSPNGSGNYSDGVWTFGEYQFYDNEKLFAQVQKYINELKAANFDHIVVITHMCKSTYESDNRYIARTDSLIRNTNGLTAVIQGHYNFATNAETISDKGGKPVLLAHEAGANMNSFGRLQLKGSRISSYLLDERSDLNVI